LKSTSKRNSKKNIATDYDKRMKGEQLLSEDVQKLIHERMEGGERLKVLGENYEEGVKRGVDKDTIYTWLSGFFAGFGVAWLILTI